MKHVFHVASGSGYQSKVHLSDRDNKSWGRFARSQGLALANSITGSFEMLDMTVSGVTSSKVFRHAHDFQPCV